MIPPANCMLPKQSSSLVPTEDDLKETCTYLAAAWGSPTRLAWVIHLLLNQWSTSKVNVKVNLQDFQTALFDWAPSIANMHEEEPLAACTRDGDMGTKYSYPFEFLITLSSVIMGRNIRGRLEFNGKGALKNESHLSHHFLDNKDRQAIMQRMYELWATAPTDEEGIRGGVHMYALDDDNKLQDMLIRHASPLKVR